MKQSLQAHARFIEQLGFSSVSFVAIFASGLLLEKEQFFHFSYSFTLVQVVLFAGFSYLGNPFFVFYSQRKRASYVSSALLLTWGATVVTAILLGGVLYYIKGFSLTLSFASGLSVIPWLTYDILRKKAFIDLSNILLIKKSLLLIAIGSACLLLLWGLNVTKAEWFFLVITVSFASLCRGVSKQVQVGRVRATQAYIKKNHAFARWTLLSAATMWFLSSGVLLLFEPLITREEFNGLRLMLSFIGLANLITTVLENSMLVEYAEQSRQGVVSLKDMKKRVLQVSIIGLLLSALIYVVSWVAFATLYKPYQEVFYQYQSLVLLAILFSINKVSTACLKINHKPNFIFISACLGGAAALLAFMSAHEFGPAFALLLGSGLYVITSFISCFCFVAKE